MAGKQNKPESFDDGGVLHPLTPLRGERQVDGVWIFQHSGIQEVTERRENYPWRGVGGHRKNAKGGAHKEELRQWPTAEEGGGCGNGLALGTESSSCPISNNERWQQPVDTNRGKQTLSNKPISLTFLRRPLLPGWQLLPSTHIHTLSVPHFYGHSKDGGIASMKLQHQLSGVNDGHPTLACGADAADV